MGWRVSTLNGRLQEITAVYIDERFRFSNPSGDVIIGEIETDDLIGGSLSIKGEADVGELIPFQKYTFYGKFSSYKNKRTGITEKQFHFNSFVETEPAGRNGIIAYMVQAGQGNRIGMATANKIFDKFGEESLRIMREEPEAISKFTRVRMDYCESASKWLLERKKLEQITVRMNELMNGRGFPKSTVKRSIKAWGNKAIQVIKKDPYQLMSFPGCGFKLCDNLYLHLGLRPDRLRRQAFLVWYSIASNSDGHTWFEVNHAIRGLHNLVGLSARPAAALKLAKKICQLDDSRHGAIAIARESEDGGSIVESGGRVLVAEG